MDVIIAGCGPSVTEKPGLHCPVDPPEHVYGINDAMRWIRVDTLQLIDGFKRFNKMRLDVIRTWWKEAKDSVPSRSSLVVDVSPWPILSQNHRLFRITDMRSWLNHKDKPRKIPLLPSCKTSLVAALWGAHKFSGATRIGIIGCDIKGHSYLDKFRGQIAQACEAVVKELEKEGVEVATLSPPLEGALKVPNIPHVPYPEWTRALRESTRSC